MSSKMGGLFGWWFTNIVLVYYVSFIAHKCRHLFLDEGFGKQKAINGVYAIQYFTEMAKLSSS